MVQGNLIGTQIDGKSPLGNTGAGIEVLEGGFLTDSDPNVRIGAAIDSGMTPESAGAVANTIAFNRTGIETTPFTFGLTYLANSIYANSGLGIDIVPDGVNPNDNDDGTGFGNKTQNYPELTSAQSDGDSTTVGGTLNSTPNASFRVEFFANEKANATRYGDGPEIPRRDHGGDRLRRQRRHPRHARGCPHRPVHHRHGDQAGLQHVGVLASR